jgi:hypothetical protein
LNISQHIIHSGKINTVEELACQYHLSMRQFGRELRVYAGFDPKMYLCLARLSNALKQGSSINHYP